MAAPSASDYFGAMVREYDSLIRRAVPLYDVLLERAAAYLPERAQRVLELGCGTGNFTAALARRYPEAELTLVDASPEMLEAARARLRPRPVEALRARFEDLALPPARFDVVTTCISLHHVRDPGPLLRHLHSALEPGGFLLVADQMAGADERNHAINWNAMLEFWQRPGHCDPDEIAGLRAHAEDHDHYVPVLVLADALRDAGFTAVDCVWRNWLWGILTARR